ncbi:MAG TPA: hypothetical protein VGK25_11300, partial [Ignavibacteria bacterium]
MAKPKKKQAKQQKQPTRTDIRFSLKINPLAKKIIPVVLIILAVILPIYYIIYAYSINHFYSFTIDDPWIHLQFAKNLAEYGSFSYFKNEVVTAGSTSPLYTFVLAVGFLITKNEMWLSYVLGIMFFALSVFYFYRVSEDTFLKENWLVIAAALIFTLDKWINLISASGMETTMFIFILVACFYYYHRRNVIGFAVTLGLSMWVRPDAAAFIGAVVIDYILLVYLKKSSPVKNEEINLFSKADLLKIFFIAAAIVALYFAMNLAISGSIFPNTYSAKINYYLPDIQFRRPGFLKEEVWGYFTESAYSLLIIPFIIAAIKIIYDIIQKKYNRNFTALLFILALIFVYWYKLPYSHRFGRYLMPIFPFYILLFVYGLREFFFWMAKFFEDKKFSNTLNIIILMAAVVYFWFAYYKNREVYQDQTNHIYSRQVLTAKWLKNNTPEGSIIATHDVGAIAFYSDRKIIDIVGLINPEFIPKLHKPEFRSFMEEELKKQNVSYLAFLKEWATVANQTPLFKAGENVEIMYVYKYIPDKSHLLSMDITNGLNQAEELVKAKDYQRAMLVLNKLAAIDPKASTIYFLMAYTNTALGNGALAEADLLRALELYPDYREA